MSQSENTFQLREKGTKLYGTVKEATKTLIKMPYDMETDVSLEDFKYVLEGMTPVEKGKLIAWASVKASDESVRKYSRIRSGGAVGAVAVITGAIGYILS